MTRLASARATTANIVAGTDAIDLLIQDHRRFEALFAEYARSSTFHKKLWIAKQLCDELTVHARLEEELFYPRARSVLGNADPVLNKARVEHAMQKWLISQIRFDTPAAALFDAKLDVLRDYVLHHAQEEETEIFPRLVDAGLSSLELVARWVEQHVAADDAIVH